MEGRAYKLLPKLINPIVMRMIKGAVAADMDSVKQYCEGLSSRSGATEA